MIKMAKPEMMNELKEIVYKFFPKNIMKEEELYEESKEHKRFVELKESFIENESSQKEVLSLIESIFCDYHVSDCIDLNLYNCLEYNVLLNGRERCKSIRNCYYWPVERVIKITKLPARTLCDSWRY